MHFMAWILWSLSFSADVSCVGRFQSGTILNVGRAMYSFLLNVKFWVTGNMFSYSYHMIASAALHLH